MSRRTLLFCICAILAASVFMRLGFWQVSRLREKQAFNAMLVRQELERPAELASMEKDPARAHYRVAHVTGRYDYEHELVYSGRTRRGSPGVEFITPLRIAGSDTAVLVNRGWVYSPDASSVDRTKWREPDSASVTGYVELYSTEAMSGKPRDPRMLRRVSEAEIAGKLPYPVAPVYLVAVGDTADLSHPARRDMPMPDEGSHRSYAFQWFSFAAIALIGAGIVVARERRQREEDADVAASERGPGDAGVVHGT